MANVDIKQMKIPGSNDTLHFRDDSKGQANGIAELDANGKVPSAQLPSYVDDVLEYASTSAFPSTGETGKIYVALDTNKTYRWSGSAYVEISPSLALGETSSTAYRGDRGKTAYDHATDSSRLTTATASGFYKVASTNQGHIASLTAVAKSDITALGIPGSDTNTHRPIQVNGTEILGNNTTALNIKAGSNVSVTNSSGTVTIAATDTTYSNATTSASGLMSTTDKTKLNGIATGAEVNQNAFSTVGVKVGNTTTNVAADSKTDTVTLIQGSNVTLTADTTNDTITIAAKDTTYSEATTSAAGLMSAADKTKLNGIAAGAEVNVQANWSQTNTSADDYIKNKPTIPVITGKADKVSGATNGNLAKLDSNGNLADSGLAAGNTSISSIGDGTVSGAISALANTVVGSFSYNATNGHIYFTPYSGSPYTFTLLNGHMMVNT